MGVTQPKRGLTSSTQRGGHSGGSARYLGSKPPPPEPTGQPGYRLSCLPRPRGPGMPGPGRHRGRTHFLPPPSGHPAPTPRMAALPPGFQARSSPAGQACREPGAGKGYSRPMLPLSRLSPSPSSCLGLQLPPALLSVTPVSVPEGFSREGHSAIHLLKACVSSLCQVASCPQTSSHWLHIGQRL